MAMLRDGIRGLQAECKNQCQRTADYVQMKTAITNTILTRSRQSIKAGWSRDQRDTVAWRVSCCKQTSTKIRKLWLWIHNSKSTYRTCYSGRMFKKPQHVFPLNLIIYQGDMFSITFTHLRGFSLSRKPWQLLFPLWFLNSISVLTVRVHFIRLIFQRKNTLNH